MFINDKFILIIEGPINATPDNPAWLLEARVECACVIVDKNGGPCLQVKTITNLTANRPADPALGELPPTEVIIQAAKLHDWAVENIQVFDGLVANNVVA